MAGVSKGWREAAGMAADGRSLSGGLRLRPVLLGCVSALLLTPAWAGHRGPTHSAPAHHFSAPHVSAPHMSAPHAQHFSSPRMSAPQQHFSAPHSYAPMRGPSEFAGQPHGTQAPATRNIAPTYRPTTPMAMQPSRPYENPGQLQNYAQNNRPPYPGTRPLQNNPNPRPSANQNNGQAGGEHLGSWMRAHQNQSPEEQERALRQEPGFNRLPQQQQQNLVNRLHQLDQMPPAQRARTMERIENLEHLSPERRQAVRSSAQQLATLPQDRKRMVQKAFRDLRDMPPEQRQAVMNSPQFAGQFSAQERSIMGNLLTVEPYQHAAPSAMQPQYGKQF